MELGSLVFALILFSVGIWLIMTISGNFKEKNIHVQRIQDAPHKSARAAPRAASAGARRQPVAPLLVKGNAPALPAGSVEAADQLQTINAAAVRETFERFMG